MPEIEPHHQPSFVVHGDQPLIGIPAKQNGEEVVRYYTDEDQAEAATPPASVQRALSLLGAWSDLDWDEAVEVLDQIRHAHPPTPPISL